MVSCLSLFLVGLYFSTRLIFQGEALGKRKIEKVVPKEVDVVIIGAGWAGLGAGSYLKKEQKSVSFAILEGNDYIGGRSKTEYFSDGTPIDLGSHKIVYHDYDFTTSTPDGVTKEENVGDEEGGILYEELKKLREKCPGSESITSIRTGDDTGYDAAYKLWDVYTYKEKLGKRRTRNLQEKVWLNGFLKYEREMQGNLTLDTDISVEMLLKSYLSSKTLSKKQKRFLHMMICSEIGGTYGGNLKDTSVYYSSSKGILQQPFEYDIGNDTVISYEYDDVEYLQGNFGAFATAYAKCKAASGGIEEEIYLENTVTDVIYDEDGAEVNFLTASGKTGKIKSRYVLVTVSLGVLKSGSINFNPPLPAWKQDVIDNAGFGVLDKWIGYWNDDKDLPWSVESFQWASFLTMARKMYKNYNLFYNAYPIHNQKNIMIGYISADEAQKMELKSDQYINQRAITVLRKMFTKDSVPDPTEFKVSRWATDPNFKGAYFLAKPGRDMTFDTNTLAASVNDTIYFAGEATNGSWYGLTQGAFISGYSEIKRLFA